MKVSVIILTWNGRMYLEQCLASLAAQTFRDFETILVDNGSSDGSAEYVRESFPWVRLLELPKNVGFAEGNNRGLLLAGGWYVVTLNNDTKVAPDFLEELVRVVDSDDMIGMVAAKMRNFYQPEIIDAAGLKIATNGLGYNIGVGEVDRGQHDAALPFGPCGGAALYRRTMLDGIGFFDPDFFAYYEDFDLAWRGRLAGWKAAAAPKALVYHIHSATSGDMSGFKVYHTHRNKWFVILINWPAALFWRHLASILATDLAALSLAMLKGKALAAVKARIDVVWDLGRLLRKRHKVQDKCNISSQMVESFFSIPERFSQTFIRKMGLHHDDRP